MKKDFLERLKSEILISDGAMGTMLQSVGYMPGANPEKWSIENREKVKSIHRSYLDAGANILLTNTLGGNRFKLKKYNLDNEIYQINKQVAQIAVEVAGDFAYAAGDIGPTGEFMEPIGLFTESEFYDAFAAQAAGLKDGGVDIFIIETMMAADEVQVAIKAAKDTGLPVIASMSFNLDRQGFRTMMGVSPEQAAKKMLEAGADVIGANCGDILMSQMPDLVKEFRDAIGDDVYIIVQANAGRPQMVENKTVFLQTPDEFESAVKPVIKAGVNIIGGCCGTTPEHIRRIAQKVGNYGVFAS